MSRMGAPRDLEDRIGKRLFRNPRMRLTVLVRPTVLVRLTFLESAFDAGRVLAEAREWMDIDDEDEQSLFSTYFPSVRLLTP